MKTAGAALVRALAALAFLALASPSMAQSLEGRWEGSWTCKSDRIKSNNRADATLLISHDTPGTHEVRASLNGQDYGGLVYPYGENPNFDGQTSGVGYFVSCTAAPDGSHTAVERIKWKISEDGGGSLKLIGVWANYYGQGACKGSFKRVDTAPPNVPPCS